MLRAAEEALSTKTGDAILAEGFLPAGKLFLGEHVAVAGFAPGKCPALNREHDRGLFPCAPPLQTSSREKSFEINDGGYSRANSAHS